MRRDAIGMFWEDLPAIKAAKKEKPKRERPNPVWLLPTYLPYLDEALAFNVPMFTHEDLIQEWIEQVPLVYDIECYINYFLIAFRSTKSGKVIYFEFTPTYSNWNNELISWIINNFCCVSFNGRNYDATVLAIALNGGSNPELKEATNLIIQGDGEVDWKGKPVGWQPYKVLQKFKCKKLKFNHIDIQEVGPGVHTSLKMYAGRTHGHKLQDLPFHESSVLNGQQMSIVRYYCVNDLENTNGLFVALKDDLQLREEMSRMYGIDLRSRSDAQIAEDVITHEVQALNGGQRITKPFIPAGTLYAYKPPAYLSYQTPLMRSVFDLVTSCNYVVNDKGKIDQPPAMENLTFVIGNTSYKMGIGGLHSQEVKMVQVAADDEILENIDVSSFYPESILGQKLYPSQLGLNFLLVYGRIVTTRLEAKANAGACKKAGDKEGAKHWKRIADSLKITINGSFGKFGSMHSVLYAPDLLIQTTITGQLVLLMLIEALEMQGIQAVSANTDGVVIKYKKTQQEAVKATVSAWEALCGFNMESDYYKGLYSANVNNYIAVKENGDVTRKGWFAEPGIRKHPTGVISMDAVIKLLTEGKPIHETIKECKDLRKFIFVRNVTGGACCGPDYLGKVVRWYYSNEDLPEIIYANNGNLVATSTGGKPMMQMVDTFPEDIDYDLYIKKAEKLLVSLGYSS